MSSGPAALGVSPAASVMTSGPQWSGTHALLFGNDCAAAGRAMASANSDGKIQALLARDKFHPPVLGPPGARAIRRHRMRLAEALGAQPLAPDAALDKGVAHRVGALAAQAQVERGRADVVRVTLDEHVPHLRM